MDNSGWRYEYYLKDHFGNTRVVFNEDSYGLPTQVNEYFPFGMTARQYAQSTDNKYLYNGKELQEGTDWYDYGARMYEPKIGRWHCLDPQAERGISWSPYAYVENNPIMYLDPDGEFKWKANAKSHQRGAVRQWGKERVSEVYYNESNGEHAFLVYEEGANHNISGGVEADGTIVVSAYEGEGIYKGKDLRNKRKEMKRTNPMPVPSVDIPKDSQGIKLIEGLAKVAEDPLIFPTQPGVAYLLLKLEDWRAKKRKEKNSTNSQTDGSNSESSTRNTNSTTNNSMNDNHSFDLSMSPSEREYEKTQQIIDDF